MVATISIGVVVLAVLFFFYALWGIRTIRSALIDETERNGVALLESMLLASQYSVTASVLTDRLGWENLATRARLAAAQAASPPSTAAALAALARAGDVDGITIWQPGQTLASFPPELSDLIASHGEIPPDEWGDDALAVLPLEFTDDRTGDHWTGAGLPTNWGGLAVWQRISAADNLPAWSGVGVLIQEIGRRSEINYIMLQSPDGIVFASRELPPVLSLADDEFLVAALEDTAAVSRELVFEGTPVLEVVKPFLSADFPSGMFRIGISLEGVEAAQRRLMIQLGLSAILFLLLASVAMAFLITRRSYGDLSRSFQRVETLAQRVLDAMDQAVIAADRRGRLTVFNRAAERLFGRRLDTSDDPTVAGVIGEDAYHLLDVAGGGSALHDQEHRLVMGERVRQLAFSTTPVITADGYREGAVSVVRDETEARAMAEQIQQTHRLTEMGNLAAGVAHEIRNPLNAIAVAAQRLRMEMTDPEAARMATTVLEESRRLNTIVENFLSLAHSSTGTREVIDFSDLVESVAGMAALQAAQNGIGWSMEIAPGLRVECAGDELRKAVWNLLTNAIAATPKGGHVTTTVRREGDSIRLTVDDTGCGIDEADKPRVFQPYYTTKDGGTGLGLAITHRIVTDHGGRIQIESPAPGADRGTRVTVELPAVSGS